MKVLMLNLAIAFFTPFATALYKKAAAYAHAAYPRIVSKLPKNTIPLFSAGVGAAAEILMPAVAGVELPTGAGLLAGLASGGLRDLIMKRP